MPKSETTVQIRPDSSTPGIRGSHAHMVERLRKLEPYRFDAHRAASGDALDLSADLIRSAVTAFEQYIVAVVRDIEAHTWAYDPDVADIMATLQDFRNDLCGKIETAAETVREERLYEGRAA